ncbi:MAG: sugar ABC transporter permease [Anaerolineae bacterium]|nr:sugar ABC transporter permease [Anaerolineae bacterium]
MMERYASGFRSLVYSIKKIKDEGWGDISGYFFIAPLIIMWAIFHGYPYIRGISIAFQDYRLYRPETWPFTKSFCGLCNFKEMLHDRWVWRGIKASFLLFVSWFPGGFIVSLLTAVLLNRVRKRWLASVYRVLITLAWVIPVAAAMPMWRQIYEPNLGYLTHLVRDVLKIWPNPPAWTSDPFWYWPSIGIASIWKGFGYYMLLFLLGLYNIPSELYDAAAIDGANAWQQFWHVELPGIRNIMLVFLVTNVGFLGGGIVGLMTFGLGPEDIGKGLGVYAYEQAFGGAARLGYGGAINLFAGIVNLMLAALVYKLLPPEKA